MDGIAASKRLFCCCSRSAQPVDSVRFPPTIVHSLCIFMSSPLNSVPIFPSSQSPWDPRHGLLHWLVGVALAVFQQTKSLNNGRLLHFKWYLPFARIQRGETRKGHAHHEAHIVTWGLGICQNDVKWCKMKRIFGGVEFWAISVLFLGKLWDLDARGFSQKDLLCYNDSVYQRHPTPRHDLCRSQTDGQSPLEHCLMKATKRAFQKVKDLTRPELLWLYTMGLSQHLELSITSHG